MLQQVSLTQVEFFPDRPNKVQHAEPHPLPGYVLATGIEANGRIVAQVYPAHPTTTSSTAAASSSTTSGSTAASTPR